MTEKENQIKNKAPTQPKKVDQQLITLTGITTSQINQALKAKNPYPARVFIKPLKQFCSECADEVEEWQKRECNNCEVPVFFRIKETPTYEGFIKSRTGKYINYSKCFNTSRGSKCMYEDIEKCGECYDKFKAEFKNLESWIKPKIKKGSYLQVEGQWTVNQQRPKGCIMRKSFTAYSYTLLSCPHSQKKPYFCPIDCPCLKGKEVLNQQNQQQILSHE